MSTCEYVHGNVYLHSSLLEYPNPNRTNLGSIRNVYYRASLPSYIYLLSNRDLPLSTLFPCLHLRGIFFHYILVARIMVACVRQGRVAISKVRVGRVM